MTLNPFEKVRYEIVRRLQNASQYMDKSDWPTVPQLDAITSIINDVFDPHVPELYECCMCGARKVFEIDTENPSVGYCHLEQEYYTLRPGPNAPKKPISPESPSPQTSAPPLQG